MSLDGLSDADLTALLRRVKTFAVIGASPKPDRPSYGVMHFLVDQGYAVHPVNPGVAGQSILGQNVYAKLNDVPAPVDVVDIFRASDAALDAVQDAVAAKVSLGASVIWMQLGVINEDAARLARDNGFTVVIDRCPKIEIRRLGLV